MKRRSLNNPRIQAKAWLVIEGIKQKDIQVDLKYRHDTQVTETLQGIRNDRKVLRYLLEKGCPAQYLNLPSDMRGDV